MTAAPTTRERLDLAGPWQIVFDPDGTGAQRGWTAGQYPAAQAESIQVPSIWNVAYPDAEGIGYYRRLVEVPAHWAGRAVRLNVDGASYRLEAWVNGRFVGG